MKVTACPAGDITVLKWSQLSLPSSFAALPLPSPLFSRVVCVCMFISTCSHGVQSKKNDIVGKIKLATEYYCSKGIRTGFEKKKKQPQIVGAYTRVEKKNT